MELPSNLVTLAPYLFFGLFGLIFVFILLAVFTKSGRNAGVELIFGCQVVHDFGDIANNLLPLGRQKLRLLGCTKDNEKFLVLEARYVFLGSFNATWVKIDDSTLQSINSAVKPNF